MTIALFLIIRILFILAAIGFILLLAKTASFKDTMKIIHTGFMTALNRTGLFLPSNSHKVEVYQWVPDNSIEICPESEECAQMAAMDLADWMDHGFPKSPDAHQTCERDCNCKLICIKKQTTRS